MKQYIIVDDRFKIGQYLIGIAKMLMPGNKSIKIVSEVEFKKMAISPTSKTPYNATTQKALISKKTFRAKSTKALFDSI